MTSVAGQNFGEELRLPEAALWLEEALKPETFEDAEAERAGSGQVCLHSWGSCVAYRSLHSSDCKDFSHIRSQSCTRPKCPSSLHRAAAVLNGKHARPM